MKKLTDRIDRSLHRRENWLKSIKENPETVKGFSLNLRFLENDLAVLSIAENNISKGRQHFFNAALLDKFRVEKFNDTVLDFGLPYVVYPILSDNEELIMNYSKVRYIAWGKMPSMSENVLNGESAIWCNTVQLFMANDLDGVKRNLNILETITLPKLSKKEELLKIDYEFYKALLEKNKSKCEEILEQLISPKIHAKRNDNPILSQYVSQPALGYAKLAWRYDLEVEVNSPLVPKELLPIVPLEHYEIPYDFLMD